MKESEGPRPAMSGKAAVRVVASLAMTLILSSCARSISSPPEVVYDAPADGPDVAYIAGSVYDPGLVNPNVTTNIIKINGYRLKDGSSNESSAVAVRAGKNNFQLVCASKGAYAITNIQVELEARRRYTAKCRKTDIGLLDLLLVLPDAVFSVDRDDGQSVISGITTKFVRPTPNVVVVPVFTPK